MKLSRRTLLCLLASSTLARADTKKVVLLGDSEAFLLGHELPALCKASGWDCMVQAVPGSSVRSWADGLHTEWGKIRKFNPDIVLVSLGANDACLGQYTLENHEEAWLQKFQTRAKNTPGLFIWAGPPKIGGPGVLERAISGLEFFQKLIVRYNYPYIDARKITVTMWSDLLHPDLPGRKAWAKWLWQQAQTIYKAYG